MNRRRHFKIQRRVLFVAICSQNTTTLKQNHILSPFPYDYIIYERYLQLQNKNVKINAVIKMGIDLKKWMTEIEDARDLFSLNLCGTHDCVTQHIRLAHFFSCQDTTIYEQLCLGVRALDIRVKSDGKCLTMVHAVMNAYNKSCKKSNIMDMGDVLSQCYRFLDENPGECILFQFKNDNGKENEACFDNLFYTYIKGKEPYWYTENRIPTLKEARGKMVLIRRCNMAARPEFTSENTGIDFSAWVEQGELTPQALPLLTGNADFLVQDRFKYKPVPRWSEVIEPFLDQMKPFNGKYVIQYLSTAGGLKGPKNNAKYINARFMEYPLKPGVYYGTVYVDFPTRELVCKIIETNFNT